VDGAFIIIAWVGAKLLLEFLHREEYVHFEIPNWISLGVIVAIFVAAFLYARRQPQRTPASAEDDQARHLFDEDGAS
jgi:predicted tellurium resistance membrane protein TerC